ncbi:MAG: cell wall metabolism sensor histidine kinase WalK [Clostridiales bacterium]|nr:cell wall metabolism sensor histidine kinase WalK [Clostridiales bacterium]
MQKKIFAYTMSVLIITLVISGFFTFETIKKVHFVNIEEKLVSEAYILSQVLAENMLSNDIEHMKSTLSDVGKELHVRITVIDNQGMVLGETDYDPKYMENHLQRPEVQEAFQGEVGKEIRYSGTLKVDLMYIAYPIFNADNVIGVVRLSTPIKEINGLRRSVNTNLIIAFIPGLLLSLLLMYRISVSITRPIKEIKDAAVDITHGKLDRSINIISTDEIGELAKAIDFMAASLREKINSIKDKNTKMEAILSSVVNGIIAVDSHKNILFINPMAQKMLNITEVDIAGKHLLQVIRNNKIDNMIKNILENRSFEENEITVSYPEEKIFRLYSNSIKYPDSDRIIGIIIIMQDVTEIKKLEKMRSEFVANVSHELKTPLTSIKGFVETLKLGAIEDKDASTRFLNIIEDEADRLNRLIIDILSLSELETQKTKSRLENINTYDKIMEIVSMLQNQASKKNINLLTNIATDVSKLEGDSDQFKQMLINLVDNAIKYTPEYGVVEIAAYNSGSDVVIRIKDNGIGIPKEHIPRLFERFYRVDKARSRNVGGTGLGLAIVKYIAMQFESKIEVQSEVSKGTEFILTIPTKA